MKDTIFTGRVNRNVTLVAFMLYLQRYSKTMLPHANRVGAYAAEIYETWAHKHRVIRTTITTVKDNLRRVESSRNRKQINRNVQQERMTAKGTIASGIIHDVKNALTGIRTCAKILGDKDLGSGERKEFLQLLATEIDRVTNMAQELLECSYGHQFLPKFRIYSVESFIHDILPIVAWNFVNHKISIQLDLHYTGPFEVDIEKMKRVLMNIVSNARNAMPEGGVLTIRSYMVNDLIHLTFTDTGCGMSPELQARFLEPFVSEGKPSGTGLGMAIVKEILDQHHARIEVESAVTQGTTICILLPRTQDL